MRKWVAAVWMVWLLFQLSRARRARVFLALAQVSSIELDEERRARVIRLLWSYPELRDPIQWMGQAPAED